MNSKDYPNIRKFIIDCKGTYDFDKIHNVINMMDDKYVSEKEFLEVLETMIPRLLEGHELSVNLKQKLVQLKKW